MYDLTQFGGRMISRGPNGPEWNFGRIAPDDLNSEQADTHDQIHASMPPFMIDVPAGTAARRFGVGDKFCAWDCDKANNGGRHFRTLHQITGSCVGHGGGGALWRLISIQRARLGLPQRVVMPFFLLPYGISRMLLGDRGQGEGSSGTTFAKALSDYGCPAADEQGLPQVQDQDGLTYGRQQELVWSNGSAISHDWLTKAKSYLVRSAAKITSTDAAFTALMNAYPLTIASNWGGSMQGQVRDGVLLNKRAGTWNHQMCVIAAWWHQSLGKLFFVLNSWGEKLWTNDPSGAPPGGFWIQEQDMAIIIRAGETFALSQFNGFPQQEPLSWVF